MIYLILAGALAASQPAAAQHPEAIAATAPDAARLAAAQRTIDLAWPPGMLARIMGGSMRQTVDSSIDGLMGMRVGDFAGAAKAGVDGNASIAEIAERADPHFRERHRILMETLSTEMTAIMSATEPEFRSTMVRVYARRFTLAELEEMNAFLSTPTGRKYSAEAVTMMQDPEVVDAMQGFTPRLLKALPAIMEKAKKASAHLPPPPAPRQDEEER